MYIRVPMGLCSFLGCKKGSINHGFAAGAGSWRSFAIWRKRLNRRYTFLRSEKLGRGNRVALP